MLASQVPVKTQAGMREIGIRAHKLSPRARSLLIAINGSQTVAEIAHSFHALGDVSALIEQLAALGLIEDRHTTGTVRTVAAPVPAANDDAPAITPAFLAKQLMNESAVAVLGLRAFLFTLKLEHCYTPEDLRGLLGEYARVVGKAKGEPFAQAMVQRVESLLAG